MKILLVHFSDIHFKNTHNSVSDKLNEICSSLNKFTNYIEHIIIAISGDIAFSGSSSEYDKAIVFFENMQKTIYKEHNIHCKFVFSPGNHDCFLDKDKEAIRNILINDVIQKQDDTIEDSVISECCKAQHNYQSFIKKFISEDDVCFENNLISIYKFKISDNTICVFSYNTAWLSTRDEEAAKLYFPIGKYKDTILSNCSNINISLLHHPFNWNSPVNSKELMKTIEESSNIILTGHEHDTKKYQKIDIDTNHTEYVEGGILQDNKNEDKSEFNSFIIDLDDYTYKSQYHKWNETFYSISKESKYFPIGDRKNNSFVFNEIYYKELHDPGASFKHPEKEHLDIDDIFIFPDLRPIKYDDKSDDDNTIPHKSICSASLCDIQESEKNKTIIAGSEKSGKSTLCKTILRTLLKKEFVPIIINGRDIKSNQLNTFEKVLRKSFVNQFSKNQLEHYDQVERLKIVIIIDNFDKTKLNIKNKSKFIENLCRAYNHILIFVNDIFLIEEISTEDDEEIKIFDSFDHFELREFGHFLRNSLINKWNSLGNSETISQLELIQKNDQAKQIIDTIIGKNFVPAYPIFLLILLQTIESGAASNLKESSYGYYYNFLIIQSISSITTKNDEMDAYDNYITELSYFLFLRQTRELSKDKFEIFHKWLCEEYKVSLNFNDLLIKLQKAAILESRHEIYKFKYPYVRYYFVAKYLSNTISEEETKTVISAMCKRLYKTEFANIIMFLTYHSKDPFILEQIISNAKTIFYNLDPITFEGDVESINNLIDDVPKIILDKCTVKDKRENRLKLQDEVDEIDDYENINDDLLLDDDILSLDLIPKLNLAFKTIEILGQILKNYYGSLKGDKKYTLGCEAYNLGLRSLNVFFTLIEEHSDFIVYEVEKIIEKKKFSDRHKSQQEARKLVFQFSSIIAFIFIKKISESVGSEKLKETYREILEKNNKNSTKLIDLSIKLDFYKSFPLDDILQFKKDTKKNLLPYSVLKYMVVNYLYMFPTDYKLKQKICNTLGISIQAQRHIESSSKSKKRE